MNQSPHTWWRQLQVKSVHGQATNQYREGKTWQCGWAVPGTPWFCLVKSVHFVAANMPFRDAFYNIGKLLLPKMSHRSIWIFKFHVCLKYHLPEKHPWKRSTLDLPWGFSHWCAKRGLLVFYTIVTVFLWPLCHNQQQRKAECLSWPLCRPCSVSGLSKNFDRLHHPKELNTIQGHFYNGSS